jgi:hypothetical protein
VRGKNGVREIRGFLSNLAAAVHNARSIDYPAPWDVNYPENSQSCLTKVNQREIEDS